MNRTKSYLITLIAAFTVYSTPVWADAESEVQVLQTRWAEVNYQLSGDAQAKAFEELATQADQVTNHYPDTAAAWIWSGIIKSTYAGAKGGLGALSIAKASKRDLEKAMKIDAAALDGSAYTSLGTLYFNVPGWPVGFGDDDRAEELLAKALNIAPDSIDTNYFYAEFKRKQKDYKAAREYYLKAQSAPARPGRELADSGRQGEITKALADLN
ncbi:MAG: hypothetical protein WD772_00680 [Pseudohongiellaceae bacterium]